jgi:hypothetical protein
VSSKTAAKLYLGDVFDIDETGAEMESLFLKAKALNAVGRRDER